MLAPCPNCARHINAGSSSCPFCASAVRKLAALPLAVAAALTMSACPGTKSVYAGPPPTPLPAQEPAPTGEAAQAPTGEATQAPTGPAAEAPTGEAAAAPSGEAAVAPSGEAVEP